MSARNVIKAELDTAAGFNTTGEWADRILAALTRHRYAVIKLPKPTPDLWDWGVLIGSEPESVYVATRDEDPITISGAARVSAQEARDLAAALLAAADAADAIEAVRSC